MPNAPMSNLHSDPLPFQWLTREPSKCQNVKFIDVDYEELMISKREVILSTPKMKSLLTLDDERSSDSGVILDSNEYVAIGCDLRNIQRLNRLLRDVVSLEKCLLLCIAEVSITYMLPDAADAIIAWSARLSPGRFGWQFETCGG